MEIGEFHKWLLKSVQTRDKSSPDFTVNQTNERIVSFDKGQLIQTKTASTAPTHFYVSQLVADEITKFDKQRLRSFEEPEDSVLDNMIHKAVNDIQVKRRKSTSSDLSAYLLEVQEYMAKLKSDQSDGKRIDESINESIANAVISKNSVNSVR